ncbi:MAG: exodeoxyribonuclease V subunit gamma, partial [Ruminobacter sp.]|nr:exodeoxyribonuclease V subunit gamma [Ruminobacter sp.]
MFTVYHSNDIEILVRLGIHLMKSSSIGNTSGNPFSPFHFIVQSNGMELYLKQKIADIEGVCARIECLLPWRFIWSLHDKLFPKDNYPKEMVYNSDNIAWILLQAFTSDEAFKPDNTSGTYGYVIDYIYERNGNDGVKSINYVKCYSLAHRLAEIFENYLVYRQDWIKSWSKATDDESLSLWLRELKEKHHADINIDDYLWISRLWHDYIQVNLIDDLRDKDRIHYMDSMKEILLHDTREEFFDKISRNGMEMPSDIFVYGISSIAPAVLEFLVLLGKFINVHFMFTNPCRYYWGDIRADNLTDDASIEKYIEKLKKKHALNLEVTNRDISPEELSKITSESGKSPVSEIKDASGDKYRSEYYEAVDDSLELVESNRLLLTYGKAGRDTLSAIMAYADNEGYEINDIHAFVDNSDRKSGDDASLLNLIKNDILNMSFTSMTEIAEHTSENGGELSRMRRTVSTNDHSLEFHSCITPLREVQVLYDHILEKFQNDKSLRPRDIAVFMPNVSKYAPFIDAVFGTNRELLFKKPAEEPHAGGERQKINLPYSICDRSTEEECPEIDGFNRLLNIVSGNIDNHALFSLLSIDAIRKRFGIEVEDLENI